MKRPAKKPKPKVINHPVFHVSQDRRGIVNVTKLTRNAMRQAASLKRKRDKYARNLGKICYRVVTDFAPINQIELTEQLAVRAVAHSLCQDRARYLAKGKLIPEWEGPLEYQFRVMTALLLLLEPYYDDDARRPAKTPGRKKPRR